MQQSLAIDPSDYTVGDGIQPENVVQLPTSDDSLPPETLSAPQRTRNTHVPGPARMSQPPPTSRRGFVSQQERAEEAANRLVFAWAEYGVSPATFIEPEKMPTGILAEVAEAVAWAASEKIHGFANVLAEAFEGAPEHIRNTFIEACQGPFPATPDHCAPLVATLLTFHREKRKRQIADRIRQAIEAGDEIDGLLAELSKLEGESAGYGISTLLEARKFDAANPPEKPVPILIFAGHDAGTPGNIMVMQAQMKSGKTGFLGGMLAAFFTGRTAGDYDTLGFRAENPEGHAVIHFDSEQSRYDHDRTIRRALARVRMTEPPEWFVSFCLTDLATEERAAAMYAAIAEAEEKFGGVRAIILDGIADFARDPNDSEEAFALVARLHTLAVRLNCLIVGAIHENPNSENGKTRGHLGSQLARKAETNLRLHKDAASGVTTAWADYSRSCHIPKGDGICFAWSKELGRHVSVGTARELKDEARREKFRDEAERAFGDAEVMAYTQLVETIVEHVGVVKKTAEKRVATYAAEGLIQKHQETGNYSLK